jgi:hypothetical protein
MPNPFVTRALGIVYGTQTIGGTSKLVLSDVFKQELKYASGSIECRFWIAETDDATFIATCAAVEAALTLPRQRLQIQVNGVALEDWNPAPTVNTGFNQRVQLTKPDDPMNTTRLRVYSWRCEFDRPAVLAGQEGRLESTVNLAVEPGGRRRLTVSGTYTALTTNSARAQYTAAIGGPAYNGGVGTGYLGTLTQGFGGSWEIVGTPQAAADDTNKLLRFSVALRDLFLNESVALLKDPDLTDQVLTIRRAWAAPGDSSGKLPPAPGAPAGGNPQSSGGLTGSITLGFGTINVDALDPGSVFSGGQTFGLGKQGGGAGTGNVRRLQQIEVDYSVWVVNRSMDLRQKWEGSIVPWIVKHVTTVAQLGIYAVTRIAPQFDYVNSRISGNVTFVAPNGSNLLSQTIATSDHDEYGWSESPVWSGNVHDKYLFQGPARRTRTIQYVSSFIGAPTQPPPSKDPGGQGYTLLDRNVQNTPLTLGGFAGLGTFDICNQTITEMWLFSTTPKTPQTPPPPNRTVTNGGTGNNSSGIPNAGAGV